MSHATTTAVRVSVITPFLNARRFLAEAIESVLEQTYTDWELLLADDGSRDGSAAIAQRYAELHHDKIRYLAHPGRERRGQSPTRNLALAHARGEYIAQLDADDVWLPGKLDAQVHLLDTMPEVGAVCGQTLIWYGWTGKPADARRDHVLRLGLPLNTPIAPPLMLTQLLRGRAQTPCNCSLLIRRSVVEQIGGWEEQFRKGFTDQPFNAKLSLTTTVFAADGYWEKYRQHPHSVCADTDRTGEALTTELAFLAWLEKYLVDHGWEGSEAWHALRSYVWWRHRHPFLFGARNIGRRGAHAIGRGIARVMKIVSPGAPTGGLGAEWRL